MSADGVLAAADVAGASAVAAFGLASVSTAVDALPPAVLVPLMLDAIVLASPSSVAFEAEPSGDETCSGGGDGHAQHCCGGGRGGSGAS